MGNHKYEIPNSILGAGFLEFVILKFLGFLDFPP
jgi:hypothetical protein